MTQAFSAIPWLGVAAGALAYFALGAAWFTPLFGRAWDRAVGFDRAAGARFSAAYYVMPLVGSVLPALAIGVLVGGLGLTAIGDAVLLGLVVGLGVAAAVSFTNAVLPPIPHPLVLGAVTAGYHVAGSVIVAVLAVALS